MTVQAIQGETLEYLKSFVRSAIPKGHKFAATNTSQRQNNYESYLTHALIAGGIEIPKGTRYVVFGLPGKVRYGYTICTFFLGDRQLTVRDDGLRWTSYDRPIRRLSSVQF